MATSAGGNGAQGDVIYSYEPTGGAEGWSGSNVYGGPFEPPSGHLNFFEDDLAGVACVTQGMCIVGDRQSRVMVAVPRFTTAPSDTGTPVLSGTPAVGEVLSCSTGEWVGEPAPIFTEQWLRNGAPMPDVTSNTYVVQAVDIGDAVSCEVTAANGAGRKSVDSNTLYIQTVQETNGGGSSEQGNSEGRASNGESGSQSGVIGAPSDAFALDGIEVAAAHGTVRLTLTLPVPGIVKIVGKTTSVRLASNKQERKTLLVARAGLTVSKAGRISATLAATGKIKRMLSRQGKLKAILTITYTPKGGVPRSIKRAVTFRLKRHR